MKRILIIATLVALAQAVAAFSQVLQTFPKSTSVRSINVSAQTISLLPASANYIVDLTRRGVAYEFSPQGGLIDFSRVRIRTPHGEFAIGSFLDTRFPRDKLREFKLGSQAFSLGTRPAGTVQPLTRTLGFTCGPGVCACTGNADCIDLIFKSDNCGGEILCFTLPHGEKTCLCSRSS